MIILFNVKNEKNIIITESRAIQMVIKEYFKSLYNKKYKCKWNMQIYWKTNLKKLKKCKTKYHISIKNNKFITKFSIKEGCVRILSGDWSSTNHLTTEN